MRVPGLLSDALPRPSPIEFTKEQPEIFNRENDRKSLLKTALG